MKIYDNQNLTSTTASETGRAQESQRLGLSGTGKSSTGGGDGSNDRVEFSGTMGQLSRALSTFESSRANRVQNLAAQYQSGNYQPNSAATSRGMIAEAISAGIE